MLGDSTGPGGVTPFHTLSTSFPSRFPPHLLLILYIAIQCFVATILVVAPEANHIGLVADVQPSRSVLCNYGCAACASAAVPADISRGVGAGMLPCSAWPTAYQPEARRKRWCMHPVPAPIAKPLKASTSAARFFVAIVAAYIAAAAAGPWQWRLYWDQRVLSIVPHPIMTCD